jgi:hypothetical protein
VTLGCATPDAEIYYSIDGSTPVPGVSARYSAPLTFTGSTQLNAIACKNGQTSSLASGLFSIGIAPGVQTATSGFSATYFQNADFGGTSIKRIDPTIDSLGLWNQSFPPDTRSVRWTGTLTARFSETYTFSIASPGQLRLWIGDTLVIDGLGQPSAQELSGVVHLDAGQTYPVRLEYLPYYYPAYWEDISLSWSGLSTAEEVVPACQVSSGLPFGGTVATPVATPAGGAFIDTISVNLSADSPAGARIYYTLDGSDPSAVSALYTAPIISRQSATIKAIASAPGFNDSGVRVTSYTLDTAAPVLSNLTFNGAPVPASITTNGAFGITATSNVGVRRVDFRLDGQLIGSSTAPAAGFTAQFSIGSVPDGMHTLTVQAWDVAGKPSDILTTTIQVALPAPIPPVITSPADGKKVTVARPRVWRPCGFTAMVRFAARRQPLQTVRFRLRFR